MHVIARSPASPQPLDRHGLRPRDDEGRRRHCERSEAIQPFPQPLDRHGLRPRDDEGRRRHCERSEAIQPFPQPLDRHGLRPRDDEGQHRHCEPPLVRHCERSEAIHASPWITNFTASYSMPKMGTINPNMGFIERVEMNQETGLGDALFSTTQQRVLGYLFGQPERTFFANELIALTGGGSGAVQRELKRLETSGLLKTERRGNQKHYQANENSPIYAELCGIVQKTFGLAGPLKNALTSFAEQIQAAFIFGSVAKNRDTASSDIDLMVISDSLAYADLYTRLTEVEQQLGRQINPTIYTREELLRRINDDNAFVSRVLNQAKIWLIGNEHAITP